MGPVSERRFQPGGIMIRGLSICLVAVFGCALVAGCGSSSNNSTSSSQTVAPAVSATGATPAPAATGASGAALQQAVAACKQVVRTEPTLSASVKTKVEGICNKAASGDLEGARKAAKEVCTEVIDASQLPAAAKEQVLADCKAQT